MNAWILMFVVGAIIGILSGTKYLEPYMFGWALTFSLLKLAIYLFKIS